MELEREAGRVWEEYRHLLDTVVRSLLKPVGSEEDVEECVQDILWEYLSNREKWDPARGSEKTYLCVLARSRAKTLRKKLAGRAAEPLEEGMALVAGDDMERSAVQDALKRALGRLTPEERRLFTLRFVYEWPTAELARQLGISESAVTTRTQRLRGKLKRLLSMEGLGVEGV